MVSDIQLFTAHKWYNRKKWWLCFSVQRLRAALCAQGWKAGRSDWSSQTERILVSPPWSSHRTPFFLILFRCECMHANVCVCVCVAVGENGVCLREPCFLWGVWECVSPLSLLHSVWLPPSGWWSSGTAETRASRQEVRKLLLKTSRCTHKHTNLGSQDLLPTPSRLFRDVTYINSLHLQLFTFL